MAVEEINHGYSNLWLQIHVLLMEKLDASNTIKQSVREVCDEKYLKTRMVTLYSIPLHYTR
jgi:hypothetical protein